MCIYLCWQQVIFLELWVQDPGHRALPPAFHGSHASIPSYQDGEHGWYQDEEAGEHQAGGRLGEKFGTLHTCIQGMVQVEWEYLTLLSQLEIQQTLIVVRLSVVPTYCATITTPCMSCDVSHTNIWISVCHQSIDTKVQRFTSLLVNQTFLKADVRLFTKYCVCGR